MTSQFDNKALNHYLTRFLCLGLFICNAAFLILLSSDYYILGLNLESYTIIYDAIVPESFRSLEQT